MYCVNITGAAAPKAWSPSWAGHKNYPQAIITYLPVQPDFLGICMGENGLGVGDTQVCWDHVWSRHMLNRDHQCHVWFPWWYYKQQEHAKEDYTRALKLLLSSPEGVNLSSLACRCSSRKALNVTMAGEQHRWPSCCWVPWAWGLLLWVCSCLLEIQRCTEEFVVILVLYNPTL